MDKDIGPKLQNYIRDYLKYGFTSITHKNKFFPQVYILPFKLTNFGIAETEDTYFILQKF